jgi:hypothetical protein
MQRALALEHFESRELLTSVTLTPVADNTLFQDNTTGSDGAGPTLFAGVTAGRTGTPSPRRALLEFDVANNVPAGAHIDSVTLQLNDIKDSSSTNSSDAFGVYLVQASWGEGTSVSSGRGATASANDATWDDRFFGPPAQAWTNKGGDFNTTPSATTTIAGLGPYTWTSAQLAADVQAWLNSSSIQFGWLLKPVDESTAGTAREFESRQSNLTTPSPPKLTINFTLTNAAPVVSGPATASVAHGGTFNFAGANALTVSDSDGGSSTESVALSVTSGTLALNSNGVNVTSGASGTGAVTISGTLANLNTALATLSYTAPNSGTSATLTATANDGVTNSSPHSTTITLTNVAPVVSGPSSASVSHGSSLAFSGTKLISVSDLDGGSSTESVALSVTSGILQLNTNGVNVTGGASGTGAITISGTISNLNSALATLSYTAPGLGVSATLSATANDGSSSSSTLSTSISLTNVAPAMSGPTTASVAHSATLNFTGSSTISVSDLDAGSNTESVALSVTSGTLALNTAGVSVTSGASGSNAVTISGTIANLNAALATLAYTAPGAGTSATLTASANDGTLSSNTLTTVITLTTPIDHPPTIDPISDVSILQDSAQQTVNLTGITAGPGDNQALSVTVVSDNPTLINPTVQYTTPNSTGSLTFTPAAGQTGSATITVTVRDAGPNGILGDGDDGQTTTTFTVHVLSPDQVNHAPSFQIGPDLPDTVVVPKITDEDSQITFPSWATSISAGPASESNQTVSFIVTTDADAAFAIKPAIDPTGTLTFKPAPNAHTTVLVSVKIKDNGGTAAGGVDTSAVQTFHITITKPHPWHNTANGLDVSGDNFIAANDALAVINYINAFDSGPVPANAPFGPSYFDVNNDGFVAPNDALAVINFINAHPNGEGEATGAVNAQAADQLMQLLLGDDSAAQQHRRVS